jgi:hypothetical protein
MFKKDYFEFNTDPSRKIEYALCFSDKIKKFINK